MATPLSVSIAADTADTADTADVIARRTDAAPNELELPANRCVLMLSTSTKSRGGIAAVVGTYESHALFERANVRHLDTHVDGSRWHKGFAFACALGTTLHWLLRRRIALVHAHVSSSASFWRKSLILWMARCFGVPTIFHLHSGGFAEWVTQGWQGRLRLHWIRNTLERSDLVIVLTPTWSQWIRGFAPNANIKVIGNPVSVPPESALDLGRDDGTTSGRVLFLGWIYDFKGCYDLLEAWVRFKARYPKWRLVMGGKGEVERLLALADKLGVREDLDFLGWVSGDAKERELRSADIFVLPSYREGMPVSLLEAMAWHVASISTPVGGVPDMMTEGVHGLWVQPGDIDGLANGLIRLAGSPSLRAEFGSAARRHVSANYSIDVVIASLIHEYSALIPRRSS